MMVFMMIVGWLLMIYQSTIAMFQFASRSITLFLGKPFTTGWEFFWAMGMDKKQIWHGHGWSEVNMDTYWDETGDSNRQ